MTDNIERNEADTLITVIPDIHADPSRLAASIAAAEPTGRLAFLGDFIDAGSDPGSRIDELAVLTEVRRLIENDRAIGILGNHELNAILFHREDGAGRPLRARSSKNQDQHQSFIDAFGVATPAALSWTSWFLEALPLWQDLDGLRLVHAFWSDRLVETIRELRPDGLLREEDLPEIASESTEFGRAVKLLVSGPEVSLPKGVSFLDTKGHRREEMRIAWWRGEAATWRELALAVPDPGLLPDTLLEPGHIAEVYHADGRPVLVGHYKMTPPLRIDSANAACIDYPSAPCVYHWRGGVQLEPEGLVSVR